MNNVQNPAELTEEQIGRLYDLIADRASEDEWILSKDYSGGRVVRRLNGVDFSISSRFEPDPGVKELGCTYVNELRVSRRDQTLYHETETNHSSSSKYNGNRIGAAYHAVVCHIERREVDEGYYPEVGAKKKLLELLGVEE